MNNKPAWLSDLPRSAHGGAGVLSFADGHVERKKWEDPRTLTPVQKKGYSYQFSPTRDPATWPDNRDALWLRAHTTGRK